MQLIVPENFYFIAILFQRGFANEHPIWSNDRHSLYLCLRNQHSITYGTLRDRKDLGDVMVIHPLAVHDLP